MQALRASFLPTVVAALFGPSGRRAIGRRRYFVAAELERQRIPGLSIAVLRDGDI